MPLRRVGGTLAVALLAGCAGLQGYFREPDVNLQRVVVRGVGLSGGTMDLVVGVYNPNPFDLQGTKPSWASTSRIRTWARWSTTVDSRPRKATPRF